MKREFLLASIVGGLTETLTIRVRHGEGSDELEEWRGVRVKE
jgi:hypothetical protein